MNGQQVLETIHQARVTNVNLFDKVIQKIANFSTAVNVFARKTKSIQCEKIPSGRNRSIGSLTITLPLFATPNNEEQEPKLATLWKNITASIFITQPFLDMAQYLNSGISDKLKEIRNQYNSEMTEIEENMKKAISEFKQAENQYDAAYKEYFTLSETLEKTHDDPAQKQVFNSLKFNFKKTQNSTIQKVNQFNDVILDYNLQIEKLMSQFEQADKKREEEMEIMFQNFIEPAREISQMNRDIMKSLRENIDKINSKEDVDRVVDEKELDLEYTAVAELESKPFSFNVNEFLQPNEIFADELSHFSAVAIENIDGWEIKKGQEVTVLSVSEDGSFSEIQNSLGYKTKVESGKIQKSFERKIMRVADKPADDEINADVDDFVLVLGEKDGKSKCLTIYRTEGEILTDKLSVI
ncbi:hypothetical protein TRFO_34133 [Tritrichomonas foetus]|uniref:Uncharacterized protein n=1 Tax=Tritrichomonas foetus TaxID=1144522 RepID=A0A1J4JQA3_9EUKA|nr:hypothetical protein TRFO_34133 [Tritrichomonas foetus]|eukprot:OHS99412.1 hypothetical protein TRFO_34133 [Tritrichomonas foetus]